jgi:peptidoglycan/LPS O-acetylase OafA/YrhL
MCYSIYLLHTPLLAFAVGVTGGLAGAAVGTLGTIVQAAILAPVVLAASIGFFLLVERPCMDPAWPRKVATRLRASIGEAADRRVEAVA